MAYIKVLQTLEGRNSRKPRRYLECHVSRSMFEVNSVTVGAKLLCRIHMIATQCAEVFVRTLFQFHFQRLQTH